MSDPNPYAGVNPHLNSYLLATGQWESFHSAHITHLVEAIDPLLPDGYGAVAETSLQISQIVPSEDVSRGTITKADVLIYQERPGEQGTGAAVLTPPVAEFPLTTDTDEDDTLSAVIIYRLDTEAPPGTPITRIELLSPANKPGGSHFPRYHQKRLETLRSGMNLVELDYLHETRPVLAQLPSYPDREAGAYPYIVIVSKPRPTFQEGIGRMYGANVDQRLPTIELPLAGDDSIACNLDAPYQRTASSTRLFRQRLNAARLPENFDRYSAADHERIRQRMALIAQQG